MKLLALLIPTLIVTGMRIPALADDDVKIKIDDDDAKVTIEDAEVKIRPETKIIKKEVVVPSTVVTPLGEIHTHERVEIKQPAVKIETDD